MRLIRTGITASAVLMIAMPALAHHPMGGATPATIWHGLLSGIGHPVIGIDHFAFIILLGLASAFIAKRHAAIGGFILATIIGCLAKIGGVTLPFAEYIVAGSVILVGGMVISGQTFTSGLYALVFATAGLFHGWAYGAAITGAEPTPLVAYLAGFGAIQYAIAFGVSWLTVNVWLVTEPKAVKPRLAGAVAAGIGAAILIEQIEGLIFV